MCAGRLGEPTSAEAGPGGEIKLTPGEDKVTIASGTPILVSENTSTRLRRAPELSERWLQELIHEHPTCLPIDEIEPGIGQIIPVCMELPLRVGAVDNLLITPEGNLVMVEVKLWGNPRLAARSLRRPWSMRQRFSSSTTSSWRLRSVGRTSTEPTARNDSIAWLTERTPPPERVFADRVSRNLRDGAGRRVDRRG